MSLHEAFDPTRLRAGDRLEVDGTDWIVAQVEPRDDVVVVAVDRLSCNGARGRYRLTLERAAPLVLIEAPRAGPLRVRILEHRR